MQGNSAIGSFLDEVTKWQKRLHLIEAVLDAWVTAQVKWVQLDEVYSGTKLKGVNHQSKSVVIRLIIRCDVSSELSCPDAKPWKYIPPLVIFYFNIQL